MQECELTWLVTSDSELIGVAAWWSPERLALPGLSSETGGGHLEHCSTGRSLKGGSLILSVTRLLKFTGSSDLLIYKDKDLVVPEKWEELEPQFITNSEEVGLGSFTTTIHKANTMVDYKLPVND